MELNINGVAMEVDAPEDTPLLWVLRDHLDLTGTKFGCGAAQCGACTVHLDGLPLRSCVTPVGEIKARRITTAQPRSEGQLHQRVEAVVGKLAGGVFAGDRVV